MPEKPVTPADPCGRICPVGCTRLGGNRQDFLVSFCRLRRWPQARHKDRQASFKEAVDRLLAEHGGLAGP